MKLITLSANPAKAFLSRYRWLIKRRAALMEEVAACRERATSTTGRLDPDAVFGGGVSDRMAEEVTASVDVEAEIRAIDAKINQQLADILAAIEAVPDERQKLVLTLRYIRGMNWEDIQEQLHFERTQTYVLHGRALIAVNEWMEERGGECDETGKGH